MKLPQSETAMRGTLRRMAHGVIAGVFLLGAYGCGSGSAGDDSPDANPDELPDAGCTPTSHDRFACDGGDVYWFDSCGTREDLKESCDACAGDSCIPAPSGRSLFNFHIADGEPNRLYFDSTGIVTAVDASGFTVRGKTISGITIVASQTTGHYLTVANPFTFWDNNIISYAEGTVKDGDGALLAAIDLHYVTNKIAEPPAAANTYYVATDGLNENDGTSAGAPWKTITKAASTATAGSTVWIKAGNYGSENVVVANSGTASMPIKFIGYKSTPDDDPGLTRSVGMSFSSTEMPLLENGTGTAILVDSRQYVIVRTLQVRNYPDRGISLEDSDFTIVDNVYVSDVNQGIMTIDPNSTNNRVINSYVADCSQVGIRLYNRRNLIDNNFVCSSKAANMDYYVSHYGGNQGGHSIIRNNYIERFPADSHTGHGLSMKAGNSSLVLEYSLIEGNEIRHTRQSLEARHHTVAYNVYRNNTVIGDLGGDIDISGGIRVLNGAHHNIFDGITVTFARHGISFAASTEDPDAADAGHGNLIKNSIFNNTKFGIWQAMDNSGNGRIAFDNVIANSTFHNQGFLHWAGPTDLVANTNEIVNTIVSEAAQDEINSNEHSWRYRNCDFHQNTNFAVPNGNSNIELDPGFTDASAGDFSLSTSTPAAVYDGGADVTAVTHDTDGVERVAGQYSIGAYELDSVATARSETLANP